MARRHAGWRPLALACLVVPALATALGSSATAAPVSHCTTTSGVIVAVDFRPFGGAVDRGCSPTPTTGYDALHNAGYTTAGDDQDGSAFICRIDGDPTPAQDSCARTPPASASWSYWYADPGQSTWSLHQLGAMSTHPEPGSVDAWVFGSTVGGGTHGEPTFSPASVRATATTPSARPTPTRTTAPAARRHHHVAPATPTATPAPTRARASTGPRSSPAATSGTGHPRAGRHRKRGAAATTRSPAATPSPASSGPRIVDVSGAGASVAGGSPTGMLVGLGLVVVLAAAAGATAWRRRRSP